MITWLFRKFNWKNVNFVAAWFLLLSFTILFILKQNPRIRGPGEHYTVNPPLYSYISENARDIYMIIWIKAVNSQLLQSVGYQFWIMKKKLFVVYQFVGYQ